MNILVVDDEPAIIDALVPVLEAQDYRTTTAENAAEALAAADQANFDVVLLDLGLPNMDGYEVARQLRQEHGPRLQIVAVTGYEKDTGRLEDSGFDHHLIKPPDMSRLLEWLRRNGKEDMAWEA